MEKEINTRIVHKHDTETNWSKVTSFIPKQAELIIYDIDNTHDYERFKIGDGTTTIDSLPFLNEFITNDEIDEICNATIYMASEVIL